MALVVAAIAGAVVLSVIVRGPRDWEKKVSLAT